MNVSKIIYTGFNPRTRAGCDVKLFVRFSLGNLFQSTHPCRVRHLLPLDVVGGIIVSIHAPVQGATPAASMLKWIPPVSIHAPVQGATVFACSHFAMLQVSIHAPVQGATFEVRWKNSGLRFQSTHPCRVRLSSSIVAKFKKNVSIHAPVQGATLTQTLKETQAEVSIHAPVQGATTHFLKSS